MLVRRMVDDQVEDDSQSSLVTFANQSLSVFNGAVVWVDGFVVTDVVAYRQKVSFFSICILFCVGPHPHRYSAMHSGARARQY